MTTIFSTVIDHDHIPGTKHNDEFLLFQLYRLFVTEALWPRVSKIFHH
jgi:hypothetical protein